MTTTTTTVHSIQNGHDEVIDFCPSDIVAFTWTCRA
jgi:hypothetical protein